MMIEDNSLCHDGLGHREKKGMNLFMSERGIVCLPWPGVSLTYIKDGCCKEKFGSQLSHEVYFSTRRNGFGVMVIFCSQSGIVRILLSWCFLLGGCSLCQVVACHDLWRG